MKLPSEAELLELFEVAPVLLDDGVAWAYNTITFSLRLRSGKLTCVLVPGYSTVEVRFEGAAARVELNLTRVERLAVANEGGADSFVLSFVDGPLGQLRIRLRPEVEFIWRMRSSDG